MNIISHEQARELAIEDAKKQLVCEHNFVSKHIEILNKDIRVCSKCHLSKEYHLLMQSLPCFKHYHWYKKKCWMCPIEILCQTKPEKELGVKKDDS